MYAALAKATSHPHVNIRRKIHLNHKNKIADQFYFFCALLSFLTSGRYTAQRNAECQYEIILKFKYLTAASIGIKSFSQISFTLGFISGSHYSFFCCEMVYHFLKLNTKQVFGHDTHKKAFFCEMWHQDLWVIFDSDDWIMNCSVKSGIVVAYIKRTEKNIIHIYIKTIKHIPWMACKSWYRSQMDHLTYSYSNNL